MGLISRVSSQTYRLPIKFNRFLFFKKKKIKMAASKAFRGFLPFFDRVLVQKTEAITKTTSGLYIPEAAQAKVKTAKVVAHGPGVFNNTSGQMEQMVIKEGDKVMLPDFGGHKIDLDGEEFMLFR